MTNYISNTNNNKLSAERPEGTKISTIVITYTVTEGDINKAVTTMFERGTSVHYTIKTDGFQDQHHSESQKAFYAGASNWKGIYGVNDYGIGIMLVNDAKSPFTDAQIDKTIALINDIQTRHTTTMEIVGLGEVNNKHIAPGAFFPWAKLADAGIGKSVVLPENINRTCKIQVGDNGENVLALQQKLQSHGYQVGQTSIYDEVTAKFVQNFANRYIPQEDIEHESNYSDNLACWNDATAYALDELLGLHNTNAVVEDIKEGL
jgi:N-acetylmuramoyl-L-alanine amidase